jgi:hypothetical protein
MHCSFSCGFGPVTFQYQVGLTRSLALLVFFVLVWFGVPWTIKDFLSATAEDLLDGWFFRYTHRRPARWTAPGV